MKQKNKSTKVKKEKRKVCRKTKKRKNEKYKSISATKE
jgi:hypothetical protein